MMRLSLGGILVILAVIVLLIAGVVGYDWLAPDKPEDAEQMYKGLLAFGALLGFAGLKIP
ncbi:MAG: hypothetical protein ABWY25_10965 [Paenisporosarcina sp.]